MKLAIVLQHMLCGCNHMHGDLEVCLRCSKWRFSLALMMIVFIYVSLVTFNALFLT